MPATHDNKVTPAQVSMLRNNLAFALANLNPTNEAAREIEQARLSGCRSPAFTATSGVIAFRQEDTDLGRRLYLRAIEEAERLDLQPVRETRLETRALAELHLALEQLWVRSPQTEEAKYRAKDLSNGVARH